MKIVGFSLTPLRRQTPDVGSGSDQIKLKCFKFIHSVINKATSLKKDSTKYVLSVKKKLGNGIETGFFQEKVGGKKAAPLGDTADGKGSLKFMDRRLLEKIRSRIHQLNQSGVESSKKETPSPVFRSVLDLIGILSQLQENHLTFFREEIQNKVYEKIKKENLEPWDRIKLFKKLEIAIKNCCNIGSSIGERSGVNRYKNIKNLIVMLPILEMNGLRNYRKQIQTEAYDRIDSGVKFKFLPHEEKELLHLLKQKIEDCYPQRPFRNQPLVRSSGKLCYEIEDETIQVLSYIGVRLDTILECSFHPV